MLRVSLVGKGNERRRAAAEGRLRLCIGRVVEQLEQRVLLAAHILGSATTYSTIQAAVNAAGAGATIVVDPGSYAEHVTVSKTLTIDGAQAGVDARLNSRINGATSAESVITGSSSGGTVSAAFYINANDVTIDGFTIQGETSQDVSVGAGIVIAPNRAGTHILDSIIQNNVAGLFLANNSSTDAAVIQHDVFRNNNNAGSNGGRGIYTDQVISGGNLTNVTIDANAFLNNRGSSGTTTLEAACAFESANPGTQSNIRITNNVMDGNGKAVLFFNTTNITIQGNAITNTLDQYSGTLRFEGNNHNVTIIDNTVYDNTGPAVAVDSKGVPGNSSGFVVNYNNFYGNSLAYGSKLSVVVNGGVYDGTFDARYNWWGNASGPGGDGPGTGDTVYGIGHVVSGSQWSTAKGGTELYSPWATSPPTAQVASYWGTPAIPGAIIQAEDFDHGGNGIAYSSTTGNRSGKYRYRESVSIESTSDTGGGYDVNNTVAGEWLGYTVNIVQSGTYQADFRVAAGAAGGTFHLAVDGQNVTGSLSVPATGGTQTWTTVSATGLNLSAGVHNVRIVFDAAASSGTAGSFNWFRLTQTSIANTPAAPTNLIANAANATTVNLSWQESSNNQTSFKIQRQTGATGTWTQIAAVGATTLTYSDASLSAGTTYGYRIIASNASGDSAPSTAASATTPAVATAPTNLAAVATSSTQVKLAWTDTASGVETGFLVERSADGVNFAQIGSSATGVTTFTDNSASAGNTYTYRVRATSTGGTSPYSNTAAVTTPAGNAITTYISDLSWTSATVGWGTIQKDLSIAGNTLTLHGITYAKGIGTHAVSQIVYDLGGHYTNFLSDVGIDAEEYAKGVGSVDFQVIGDGKTLFDSGVLTNSSPTVSINVSVAGVQQLTLLASNGVAGSIDYDHADWAGARLLSQPAVPAAPSNLQAVTYSANQINLSWTDNAAGNETGFLIERSTDGVNFTQISTTAAGVTSFHDVNLSAGTTYTYRVRATNSVGPSGYSPTASASTLSSTASISYLSDLAWSSATVGWGTIGIDQSIKGNPLSLHGTTYAKGIGTHATSQIVYNLAGQYTQFLSDIGLDDEVAGQTGAVEFQVIGDGKVLYDSGVLTSASPTISLDLNVTGVQQLTLVALNGIPNTIDYDHADWAGARLVN